MNYTAVRGDSLWGIYKRNKAKGNTHSWGDYKAANPNFKDGQTMHPGDSVTIPEKIIPDETETKIEEPKEEKKPVETAKEEIEETKNEPEKGDCCCMVAPWTVQEEGRAYILKVTKVGQAKAVNSEKIMDVSVKENYTNTEEKKFDFHIVTKEPKSDGKVDYKEITTKHTFLRKKCDLKILLKEGTVVQKYLKENESFKIDTNGDIKGVSSIKKVDEQSNEYQSDAYFPHACIGGKDPYAELNKLNKEIADWETNGETKGVTLRQLITGEAISKEELVRARYFAECRVVVSKLKRQVLLGEEIESEKESEFSLITLLSMLFNPAALKTYTLAPTGSPTKCPTQPTVHLKVHSYFKAKGLASFSVGGHYVKNTLQNNRTEITNASIKAAIALEIEKGSKKYAFTHEANKEKATIKLKTKNIKNSGIIFGPLSKMVSKIYKVSATSKKMSKHRGGKGEKKFDPGMTKFEFGAEDLMLVEDVASHEVYMKGKAVLSLTFFDGANITIDLIPYVVGLGGPVAKLLEKAIRTSSEELAKTKAGKAISDHIHGSIKLELEIKGSAKGLIELEFVDRKTITSTGSITGKVEFSIIGLAEAGLNAYGVEAGAGIGFKSGSNKTSDDGTDISCKLEIKQAKQGAMPTFGGDISTDGLAIYYSWYAYWKYKDKDATAKGGGRDSWSHKPELKFTESDKIELIKSFSIIDEIKKIVGKIKKIIGDEKDDKKDSTATSTTA